MPEPPTTDVKAELKKLQDSYIEKLPTLGKQIQTSWQKYQQTPDKKGLDNLYRQIHAIAGTSAVLAITGVSDIALRMEQLLCRRCTPDRLNPEEHASLNGSLEHFFALIEEERFEVGSIFH